MITYPDELDNERWASAMRYLSVEDFKKMQNAQCEAFINFFHSVARFIGKIFKKKTA
jgi:hypothetical protein